MEEYIREIRKRDTGERVSCVIENAPIGLANPFSISHAELGKADVVHKCRQRFELADSLRSERRQHNDLYNADGSTKNKSSGGIQGGISNGMDIISQLRLNPLQLLCKSKNL
jgi:chorismate synthase